MRYSLGKLLLAVALAAVACGALISHTHWWLRSVVTLTLALYTIVGVRAFALAGRDRMSAIGFVAFGAGYLILASTHLGTSLLTNYPIAVIADLQQLYVPTGPIVPDPTMTEGGWLDM